MTMRLSAPISNGQVYLQLSNPIDVVLHYFQSLVIAFACKMHVVVPTGVHETTMQQQAKHDHHDVEHDTHFMERQSCGCVINQ